MATLLAVRRIQRANIILVQMAGEQMASLALLKKMLMKKWTK